MGAIYQLTFFAALAILAILITIFVFAVSLLGRALEAASKEQEKTTKEQKDAAEKEIAAIQKQISNLRKKGRIDKGKLEELTAKLKQLRKQDEKFEKKLAKISKAPQLLTVRGGVVSPSVSLLGALILTGAAWYLSNIQIPIAPVIIWVMGLAGIAYSVIRIYRSLKVIESVAITSEAEAERRLARAVKAALIEVEEERKPKLVLSFQDAQPPFHIEAGAQMSIQFGLYLTQGDLARKPIVYFFAPPSFAFPGKKTWLQSEDTTKVGGHITTDFVFEECRMGITSTGKITVKAPSGQGNFSLRYKVTCEGFDSGLEEFEVVVE